MNIEEELKIILKNSLEDKIEEMIKEEVHEFSNKLLARKDDYIAEVMKSIRIHEEKVPMSMQNHYIITFENIVKLEN
jgi:hypothetical protein